MIILDLYDPKNNMYGCSPCPKCKSEYRWPASKTDSDRRIAGRVVCDDCGFIDDLWEQAGDE